MLFIINIESVLSLVINSLNNFVFVAEILCSISWSFTSNSVIIPLFLLSITSILSSFSFSNLSFSFRLSWVNWLYHESLGNLLYFASYASFNSCTSVRFSLFIYVIFSCISCFSSSSFPIVSLLRFSFCSNNSWTYPLPNWRLQKSLGNIFLYTIIANILFQLRSVLFKRYIYTRNSLYTFFKTLISSIYNASLCKKVLSNFSNIFPCFKCLINWSYELVPSSTGTIGII